MKPMTQIQIARKFKVARQTVSLWKREGIDLTDMRALAARAATVKAREADSEDMQAAKLRKVRAEADRQEIAAQREAGGLVLAAGIAAEGEATGRAFRNGMNRLEGELPGRLAGRTAGEIKKIIHASFRELLNELADRPSDKFLKIP